ncbi:hypothetical protein CSOJ01_12279 [Colletotrichum sojae]|uniref:Uncharacterized protein n=1 Tax=Colletotrichum sojae TaxID=2175907 RepID=A0A8H6MML8_9PEZI|nr:hypothetical protein CSOJ01_12279 [Colletotrichum sojae]
MNAKPLRVVRKISVDIRHRSSYDRATSPASCSLALPPQPRQSSNDKRTHVFTASSSSSPRPLITSGSSKQTAVAVSTAKGSSQWYRANKRRPLALAQHKHSCTKSPGEVQSH